MPLRSSKNHEPSLVLVLPPILFRHFQKFSKLLHPLRLHLSCIQLFSIMLQPRIIFTSLLRIILRRIPMISVDKFNYLLVPRLPLLILRHTNCFISPTSQLNYSSESQPLAHTYLSAPPLSPIARYHSVDSW